MSKPTPAREFSFSVYPAISFLLTGGLLALLQVMVKNNRLLLLERFLPGGGWIELAALAIYAGVMTQLFLQPKNSRRLRPLIWRIFSIVFFAQMLVGLAGVERCLMTGKLHLPIPALIIAGPLYRGSGFFMLILFLSTVLLVGPAWCSHLCYIGSWDDWSARSQTKPQALPPWWWVFRIGIALTVIATALLLRLLGVATVVAVFFAAAFGLAGVGLMLFWSRRRGVMTHCLTYCPIGLLANVLGKLSFFRMRISDSCNDCGACTKVCRFAALKQKDIQKRRPGIGCTLCGDCVGSCHSAAIHYRLLGLSPKLSRSMFVMLIISLHSVFLGVARI